MATEDEADLSTELQSVQAERDRLRELIARLEQKDKLLSKKQNVLLNTLATVESQKPKEELTPTAPIPDLPMPSDPFWGDDKVALVSYPRSGNTLLRRIIERLTGTLTGSDARPDRELVRQLAMMGMKGESVMDSRVWCVKTHYPERVGRARLVCKRAILIVRNPFDAIASYFQMMLTSSHNKSLTSREIQMMYSDLFEDFFI